MNFDIQIAHSVEEIGQETWGRLSRDRPFSSYRWYRLGETVRSDDTFIYVVLSLEKEPVACAAFRLTREEPGMSSDFGSLLYLIISAMLRRWPLLLCMPPFGITSGLFLPDQPLRDAALETIARIAHDQARQHRASFLAFPWLESHEAKYPGWPSDFAAVELPNPATYLDITWPDFDSYLSHLSRKRRKHYRRHLRYAAEMGVEITLHPTVTDVNGAMALIRNVWKKHHESPNSWTRRLLENADMVDAVWVAARIEERLVGCELILGDGGRWQVGALGRDYEFQDVYFLLGYADIRYAIEHGAQALEWAPLSYDAKRRLGFQLASNNYAVFVGNGPLFHKLGYWLAKMEESQVTDPYAAHED